MPETDICVAGAGPVGLSFAIATARQGYQVLVRDRKTAPTMPSELSANVIAVNPASADFLRRLDVWDHIPARFCQPYQAMQVVDATGVGSIRFTAEEAGLAELGHIVDQRALLAALAEVAAVEPDLTLEWETADTTEPGEFPLLIGADGAHSRIREAAGLRKVGFEYGQTATVCLARVNTVTREVAEGQKEARQWFNSTGPVALLPLSEPGMVAVVWSSFDDLQDLPLQDFTARLIEACEGGGMEGGDIEVLGPRLSFPLMQQHSLQYVAEGVALLGDAAHTIHPLAGQGANLGFADAECLAREIASARLEGQSPGDLSLLKRFEKARQPHNHLAALAMEGFHRLFTNRLPAARLLRNLGLRFARDNHNLKQMAIRVASGRL